LSSPDSFMKPQRDERRVLMLASTMLTVCTTWSRRNLGSAWTYGVIAPAEAIPPRPGSRAGRRGRGNAGSADSGSRG
jgi:hypothetical protein